MESHTSAPGGTSPQDLNVYIEAVHRLSDLGAVFTHVGHGTSREGFDAEWRTVDILTVDGDLINRCELFDEADLDAALARFERAAAGRRRDWKTRQAKWYERFLAYFAARDWDAMAEILADDISSDDRRRVVNAGIRQRSRCRDREHAGHRRPRGHET